MYCFANIGVPKNYNNPFYQKTDCTSNPTDVTPWGPTSSTTAWARTPTRPPTGRCSTTRRPTPKFLGLFQARLTATWTCGRVRPSSRRTSTTAGPRASQTVVHFYNTRNIAVNAAGHEVAFNLLTGPPAGYTPLFAPPEALNTNVNNTRGCRATPPVRPRK